MKLKIIEQVKPTVWNVRLSWAGAVAKVDSLAWALDVEILILVGVCYPLLELLNGLFLSQVD